MAGRILKRAAIVVAAVVAFEIALRLLWPRIDGNDPFPTLEQQLAVLAALALLALPHVIAILGYRGKPWLLKVAGVVALALGVAATATFTLGFLGIPLLLLPAFFYFVASSGGGEGGRVPTLLLALVATICAGGAVLSLALTDDERCYGEVVDGRTLTYAPEGCFAGDLQVSGDPILRPQGVEWSTVTDAIVFHESLPSLALSAAAIAFCAWGSRRPRAPKPAA
ncbi:MAG TPA: hypothetical protein VG318_08320 [Actinomycetota bacterium]|nr:hypothetical protein [Actinomycetota bacterium]